MWFVLTYSLSSRQLTSKDLAGSSQLGFRHSLDRWIPYAWVVANQRLRCISDRIDVLLAEPLLRSKWQCGSCVAASLSNPELTGTKCANVCGNGARFTTCAGGRGDTTAVGTPAKSTETRRRVRRCWHITPDSEHQQPDHLRSAGHWENTRAPGPRLESRIPKESGCVHRRANARQHRS